MGGVSGLGNGLWREWVESGLREVKLRGYIESGSIEWLD